VRACVRACLCMSVRVHYVHSSWVNKYCTNVHILHQCIYKYSHQRGYSAHRAGGGGGVFEGGGGGVVFFYQLIETLYSDTFGVLFGRRHGLGPHVFLFCSTKKIERLPRI